MDIDGPLIVVVPIDHRRLRFWAQGMVKSRGRIFQVSLK